MTRHALIISSASSLVLLSGCCCDDHHATHSSRHESISTARALPAPAPAAQPTNLSLGEWPADAVAGECYGKAYIPAVIETHTERVVSREATEHVEIVPARYEWAEERVMVRDACKTLVEVPAEYKTEQVTVEVRPGQTGWFLNNGNCHTADGKSVTNIFCYVTRPAVTKTVSKQVVSKGATLTEVEVPAEYTTVRRERLVTAATCRKTAIPAEYETVERTVVTGPARWEWQRVICDGDPLTMNTIKNALLANGYQAGPFNGEMTEQDWASVRAYQLANGLGVGNLSYETLDRLQVATK